MTVANEGNYSYNMAVTLWPLHYNVSKSEKLQCI